MAITLGIEVTGAKQIIARLGALDARTRAALDDGMADAAETLRAEAASAAPRKTGRLRASIAVLREGFSGLAVAARAPYARFVELGTRRVPARPFLWPALFRLRRALIARIGEIVARALGTR
jgi:HK97 gp10 family phage protein